LKQGEAEKILVEVNEVCKKIGMLNITLFPPKSDDPLSKGYQIHIKTKPTDSSVNVLVPIIQKHNLSYNAKEEEIIIYKPQPIYLNRT
jgi:hypothetical protein